AGSPIAAASDYEQGDTPLSTRARVPALSRKPLAIALFTPAASRLESARRRTGTRRHWPRNGQREEVWIPRTQLRDPFVRTLPRPIGEPHPPRVSPRCPCAPARLAFLSRRNRGMNRDPILFRVDAGPRTSYEHLARCATYAAALQRRRRPTYFLSQLEPRSLALPIKRAGNEWLDADAPVGTDEDLAETIQEIRR